jgi:formyl-CoA transferase
MKYCELLASRSSPGLAAMKRLGRAALDMPHARARHMGELYDFLHRTFATRPSAEWVALLTEADIPAIAMNTPETLLDDAHMRAVGFFGEQEHPSEGLLRTIGIPQQWSESPATLRHPAPRLGEHTEELLGEYGFGQDEIGALLQSCGARTAAPAETAA